MPEKCTESCQVFIHTLADLMRIRLGHGLTYLKHEWNVEYLICTLTHYSLDPIKSGLWGLNKGHS